MSGPERGSIGDSPLAESTPLDPINRAVGGIDSAPADPFFATGDPLNRPGPRKTTVFRDLPLPTIQNTWDPQEAQRALWLHTHGAFEWSSQLADSLMGDDRVIATLGQRRSLLFGAETVFEPANDSAAAKEVLDAWVSCWDRKTGSTATMSNIQDITTLMGLCPAQLLWDDSINYRSQTLWCPWADYWHMRYTYWDWNIRRLVAMTADGNVAIEPGNGKWIMHAPWGVKYGWMRGAIRPCAEPYLLRHYSRRDHGRSNEVHGLATRKGTIPANADPKDRDRFESQLGRLGSEPVITVTKGPEGSGQDWGYDLVEAQARSYETFGAQIDECSMAIVISIVFQNLTTEVGSGGSYAAADQHGGELKSGVKCDELSWRSTIRDQIARPFAAFNFGDPDLAPVTSRDVQDVTDWDLAAGVLQKLGAGTQAMSAAGFKFKNPDEFRRYVRRYFGQKLPEFEISTPAEPASGAPPAAGAGGAAKVPKGRPGKKPKAPPKE